MDRGKGKMEGGKGRMDEGGKSGEAEGSKLTGKKEKDEKVAGGQDALWVSG